MGYEGNDMLSESVPRCSRRRCVVRLCARHWQRLKDWRRAQSARRRRPRCGAQNRGRVTTIDNVLCVLLCRDPHAFHRLFVCELRMAVTLEGTKSTKLLAYKNAQLLRAIK